MRDLFATPGVLVPLSMEDAEVSYAAFYDMGITPPNLLEMLITETNWAHEDVTVWGKTYKQPRLVAWHGDEGASYTYSGLKLRPAPWTSILVVLRSRLQTTVGVRFNSVLLNYYRDNNDSMGMHSDDEKELGPRPTIASVSVGSERTLVFKHKTKLNIAPRRIRLQNGSLLLMSGDTQRNYKHGILKETKISGARVNLTFRQIDVER